MKVSLRKCAVLVIGLVMVSSSHATIVSGNVTGGSSNANGGVFQKLNIPFTESSPNNTVGNDNFQSHNLFGFDEGQNITITNDIHVDILAGTGQAGILSAGTVVASHYIVYDPSNNNDIIGNITFDSDILAVITSTTDLAGSDFLINTGVNYQNPSARGLEGADSVNFISNQSLGVNFSASSPGDVIRVLTTYSPAAAVPEPTSLALIGLGLIGFGARIRRKR